MLSDGSGRTGDLVKDAMGYPAVDDAMITLHRPGLMSGQPETRRGA